MKYLLHDGGGLYAAQPDIFVGFTEVSGVSMDGFHPRDSGRKIKRVVLSSTWLYKAGRPKVRPYSMVRPYTALCIKLRHNSGCRRTSSVIVSNQIN